MPKVRIDDTLEMHYEDDNFTDPWKAAETVIYHHCNGGSGRMYYGWVPTLARHYRTIRVDRRGQGQSTAPPPGHFWSLEEWSKETDVFMDRLGLDKVHLIGEATGSYVCLQYAYEHPQRVRSLTLINCVPNEGDSKLAQRPGMQDWGKFIGEGMENWVWKSMDHRFDSSKVDPEFITWHGQEKLKQPAHVTREVMIRMGEGILDNVAGMLTKLEMPTLVMCGDSGIIHNPETATRLQEMIPDCKLVVIPGIFGYIAHVGPEKCAEAWLEFVRGLD